MASSKGLDDQVMDQFRTKLHQKDKASSVKRMTMLSSCVEGGDEMNQVFPSKDECRNFLKFRPKEEE